MRRWFDEVWIDNPLLTRERRRWRRRGWFWLPLVLLAWVPMSLLVRTPDAAMMVGVVSFWQSAALSTLQTVMRPDIVLGLFLAYLAVHNAGWHELRHHLGTTLLRPAQVIVGKAAVPVLLLAALHILGAGFYYGHLVLDPELYALPFGEGGLRLHLAYVVMPLATVEDLLFATLAVLVALEQYLLRRDPFIATGSAIARLMWVGLGIAVCQWVWELVVLLGPMEFVEFLVFNPGPAFLMGNATWFGLVYPLEITIIVLTWRRLSRQLDGLLGREMPPD